MLVANILLDEAEVVAFCERVRGRMATRMDEWT